MSNLCCQVCDREFANEPFDSRQAILGIDICRACARSGLLYSARQAQGRPHPLLDDWDQPTTIPMTLQPDEKIEINPVEQEE